MANRYVFSFERSPYQQKLRTRVLGVGRESGRPFAILEDTILFPEGGGQPGDRGLLNGIQVEDTVREEGHIVHYLADPVEKGDALLELDWARRFDHMQQHSAQHLITALAADNWSWQTTAFHLGTERSDIELDVSELSTAQLVRLEEEVAAHIRAAIPITARRVSKHRYEEMKVRSRGLPADHYGSVRLVEIEGIDLNTCGGTHVSSTAEIESVTFLGSEPVRGGTRVHFVAGGRVRKRLSEHEERSRKLRALLGSSNENLGATVAQRLDQVRSLSRETGRLEEGWARALVKSLLQGEGPVLQIHLEDVELSFLQKVGRLFSQQAGDEVALLTAVTPGSPAEGVFVVAAGRTFTGDLRHLGNLVAEILEGRGGGDTTLFQGKARKTDLYGRALLALRHELAS